MSNQWHNQCLEHFYSFTNSVSPHQGFSHLYNFCYFGLETLVWTGIKKGPPRKLKFPVNEEVIQEVKKLI